MKTWMLAVVLALTVTTAYAEGEPAPILNDPAGSVSLVKEVIAKLDPTYETVWDIYNGEFAQGISGALYTVKSRTLEIASLRLGASTGMALYSGVSFDLPGIAQRLKPDAVKNLATAGPLGLVWDVIGRYGRLGVVGGYSWDHHDPVIGITAGAAVSF